MGDPPPESGARVERRRQTVLCPLLPLPLFPSSSVNGAPLFRLFPLGPAGEGGPTPRTRCSCRAPLSGGPRFGTPRSRSKQVPRGLEHGPAAPSRSEFFRPRATRAPPMRRQAICTLAPPGRLRSAARACVVRLRGPAVVWLARCYLRRDISDGVFSCGSLHARRACVLE